MYKEHLSRLNKLDSLKKQYIGSLLSLNIAGLIEKIKKDSLINLVNYGFPEIDENKIDRLFSVFKEDKFFSSKNISDICEMFEYSDDKIAHIYPEVSKFKRIVLANRVWFDKVNKLKNSNFAVLNEKTDFSEINGNLKNLKQFYLDQIPESREIIENIEEQKGNISKYREEYEKNKRYETEKKKLSSYSKSELEKQIVKYKHMLKLLELEKIEEKNKEKHTEKTIDSTQNTNKNSINNDEEKKEKKGIFNKLKSFFGR